VSELVTRVRYGAVRICDEVRWRYDTADWRGWLGRETGGAHRRAARHPSGEETGATRAGSAEAEQRLVAMTRENQELRELARQLGELVVAACPSRVDPGLMEALEAL